MPLEAVEARRLYRQVADQLRALIDSGEYAVGSRLPTERDLAEQFKVSRPTVREALIALEVEGRVRIRVGSGIYVSEPAALRRAVAGSPIIEGPFELLRAREFLEGAIAEQAARVATKDDIARIDASLVGDGECRSIPAKPRWSTTAPSMSRSPEASAMPCWCAWSASCSTSASIPISRSLRIISRTRHLAHRARRASRVRDAIAAHDPDAARDGHARASGAFAGTLCAEFWRRDAADRRVRAGARSGSRRSQNASKKQPKAAARGGDEIGRLARFEAGNKKQTCN